jgi:uncharacterized protein YndB with AHSA1/START domain
MPRPHASAVIPAPVDQVWALLRDYDGLAGWHPAVEASALDSGSATEVGAVRRLTLAGGGGVVVERLLRLDDLDRHLTYEITESPFDVRRYVATTRAAPVTDTGHTFVEWWAEYDAEAADEARLTDFFAGAVFADGLAALKKRFG